MNLKIPLKQQVINDQPWLFDDLGFSIVEDDYRPDAFGNSFVTLESTILRLRFVRDRGQVWADVGSPTDPKTWWHLLFVLEAVLGKRPDLRFDLDEAASLLRDNFSTLAEALGPRLSETKRQLDRFQEKRLRDLRRPRP